ncbi:hypothetical protein ALC60_01720 [Trachymyrmex zeteki]|uniref:Uncharacterized protein n=1 Tax=Mycetomoellerius zeteki TaxID=64791 RepID=A0A151XFZ2_9HYME|nr:hypothetical protein ALC60_01720 [Trachymyrmex zeteki]
MDRVKQYICRKSIERKVRYWECPGEKASKSPTCKALLAMSEPPITFEHC